MIRQLILLFIIIVNPACVFYGNDFTYLPVFRAQEGGSEFDVRVGANVAQTIRRNFEWNPSFETVARRSAALTARLSGCKVGWVIGDPWVQVLGLSCGGAPPAKKPNLWRRAAFSCDRYEYRHGQDELICNG